MRILLVEEDESSDDKIKIGLKKYGYTVDRLTDGKVLLSSIKTETFDVIVLDLSLSPTLGLSILREIRAEGIKTPVLILTSSESLKDKVKTFDSGADEYLIKPVDLNELFARLRALQRRSSNNRDSPLLTYLDIELNPSSFIVTSKGETVDLSRREFTLLLILLENVGHVVSYNTLNECLYGWGKNVKSNALEVHVHNIRKKLKNTQLIQTIRGIGYRIAKENVC